MAWNAVPRAPLGAGILLLFGLTAAWASDGKGFLSTDPLFLSAPLRALKVASLDLPRPLGTGLVQTGAALAEPSLPDARDDAPQGAPAEQGMLHTASLTPGLVATPAADGAVTEDDGLQIQPRETTPDIAEHDPPIPDDPIAPNVVFAPELGAADRLQPAQPQPLDATAMQEAMTQFSPEGVAIYHDPVAVFGTDPKLFPPLAFEYPALAERGLVPQPLPRPPLSFALRANKVGTADETPAEFLGLQGERLAKAEKCMAQAIYFESRGEPKRGQIAVAQVILNRVLSGYYPKDVCGTVYQNAHRHLACQFTFACDSVKDVVREPDMWVQAEEIAADMLGGRLWLDSVGRATHYHAYWVHPRWVREMRKLDRIGVHTFYRPRRWES